jgi:HMG (high mobility group) box
MYQNQYSTPAAPPPRPSNEMLKTRSSLAVQGAQQNLRRIAEGRSRVEKSPRPNKIKKEKIKAEKKVVKLDRPLSELTKDFKHVEVLDIERYVNRSTEERRREVEEGKVPGKVKRPMNSFMLYRKAYQNRAKEWCLQNNHQVVSQVCGDSWPQEPDEIKDQYSEWARIERLNHQNAHPGYKFSPTKPGTTKSKRKQSEDMSDESDLGDFEWQGGLTRRSKKPRQSPRVDQPVAYPTTRSAYQYETRENSMDDHHISYNKSSYQVTNPGRPLPVPYSETDLRTGEYYQQTIQGNPSVLGVQDVLLRKAAAPGMHAYLGLPGGQEYDMMDALAHPQCEVPRHGEQRIDPWLLAQDQAIFNEQYVDPIQQNMYISRNQTEDQRWQFQYDRDLTMPFVDAQSTQDGSRIQDPHMDVLKGSQDGWQVETLDAGGEFDKWMDGE